MALKVCDWVNRPIPLY